MSIFRPLCSVYCVIASCLSPVHDYIHQSSLVWALRVKIVSKATYRHWYLNWFAITSRSHLGDEWRMWFECALLAPKSLGRASAAAAKLSREARIKEHDNLPLASQFLTRKRNESVLCHLGTEFLGLQHLGFTATRLYLIISPIKLLKNANFRSACPSWSVRFQWHVYAIFAVVWTQWHVYEILEVARHVHEILEVSGYVDEILEITIRYAHEILEIWWHVDSSSPIQTRHAYEIFEIKRHVHEITQVSPDQAQGSPRHIYVAFFQRYFLRRTPLSQLSKRKMPFCFQLNRRNNAKFNVKEEFSDKNIFGRM